MTKYRIEFLVEKFFDGSLSVDEQAELAENRRNDPYIDNTISRDLHMRIFIRSHRMEAFRPLFEKRVYARFEKEHSVAVSSVSSLFCASISRFFPRVAIPSLCAACLLMAGNYSAAAAGTPILDALIGLPAQYLDVLFYPERV